MHSNSIANESSSGLPLSSGERRKNRRFNLHFPILIRARGDSWARGETADVSAGGVSFVTRRPFLLSSSIEYVLTFPPDLTKAPQPRRVRFFGVVVRCERVPGGTAEYAVAVRKCSHYYLSREESASLDAAEQRLSGTPGPAAVIQPHRPQFYAVDLSVQKPSS